MKKFYSLMLSMAVAATAVAATPVANRVEKPAKNLELTNVTISKVTAEKSYNVNALDSKTKKAPAKAEAESTIAGEYMLMAYYEGENDGEAGDAFVSMFEITEPDAEGKCLIKNFLADYFGTETNDLNATLAPVSQEYEGQTYTFDVLTIGVAQDLFSNANTENVPVQPYLYGPLSNDGKWHVYINSAIEFIYEDGYLGGAYSNMGMYIGYVSGNSLYGFPPIVGYGGEEGYPVEAQKPNATVSYDYETQTGSVAETSPVVASYVESADLTALVLTNFCNNANMTAFYIDKDAKEAQAIDVYGGTWTLTVDNVKGAYESYLMTDVSEDQMHYVIDATLEVDAETGNTNLLVAEPVFLLTEVGYLEKFENTVLKTPFKILEGDGNGDAGIENVISDTNAPVEYYNLQGVKVANPSNGVYVRRQGNNVSKVLVK